jgi:hypothetical protein
MQLIISNNRRASWRFIKLNAVIASVICNKILVYTLSQLYSKIITVTAKQTAKQKRKRTRILERSSASH